MNVRVLEPGEVIVSIFGVDFLGDFWRVEELATLDEEEVEEVDIEELREWGRGRAL